MNSRAGLSLRQKLALLLSGLAAAVLLATLGLAYGEVRQAALLTAAERLDRVAHQLGDLAGSSLEARRNLVQEVGQEPTTVALLRGWAADTAAVAGTLERLRSSADQGLPIELWDRRGRRVVAVASGEGSEAEPPVPLDTVPRFAPFHEIDGEGRYWTSMPFERQGRVDGWIVQLRSIGNPEQARQIESLIGRDSHVLFAHEDGPLWVTLGGVAEPAPVEEVDLDSSFTFSRPDGRRYLARATAIGGTPWLVLVETPLSQVLARPRAFLERMLTMGLILILIAMLVAWLVSRLLTHPIRELVTAADAIAGGDYQQRVSTVRGDEFGRLAGAFNAMTEQVSRTHAEMQERFEEARSLAARLEEANVWAERAREEALAANRAKSDFLATMSHEIRTPINAVIGYADLLEMGIPGPVTEQQLGYLERIKRASQLLIGLVNDVLDFAKLESGRMRVRPAISSAAEALRGAAAVLEQEAKRKGLSLVVECHERAEFLGDSQRVEQILMNLLSNAVKFTHPGGSVRLSCTVETNGGPPDVHSESWDGSWLRVDVEDTGIGIRSEQLTHIFEPFVQADSSYTRDHGGAGLGLSISRSLATMMGGSLTVESELGRGSRFTLWLRSAHASEHLEPPVEVGE